MLIHVEYTSNVITLASFVSRNTRDIKFLRIYNVMFGVLRKTLWFQLIYNGCQLLETVRLAV